jgi:hypothetical protein
MSAATIQATVPRYQEALAFWEEFTEHCQGHVNAINALLANCRSPKSEGLQWHTEPYSCSMVRDAIPSTEVHLNLDFDPWGPKITGSVRGVQEEDLHFYPEHFEFAIGSDEDDRVIAITPEGGSLTPHTFAKYVAQQFRRCYHGISLPCPESPA